MAPAKDPAAVRDEHSPRASLVGDLPALVGVLDESWTIRVVGARGATAYGFGAPRELQGRSALELVDVRWRGSVIRALQAALSGSPASGQVVLRPAGGGALVAECSAMSVTWGGRPAVAIVALDVTAPAVRRSARVAAVQSGGLFDAAPFGYLRLSVDGSVLAHNDAAVRLLGPARAVGRRLVDLVVPADRAAADTAVRAAVEPVEPVGDARAAAVGAPAIRFRGGEAGHVRCLLAITAVRDLAGRAEHLGAVLIDDTARDGEMRAAGDRADRAARLLRALPDAMLVCAPDGEILQVNAQAEALFGYPADTLVGKPIEVLVPTEQAAAHRWHRDRYTATVHARPMITGPGISARRADGSLVPVEVNLAAVDLPDGPAVLASVRDVTASRRTEAALRDSHELITGVLSAATEQAIIATDLDGRIELFSRGAERLLGWTAAEVAGKPASIFDDEGADLGAGWGLDRSEALADRVRRLVGASVSTTRPWTYRTRTGERRDVSLSVTVRHGPSGPAGLIIVATDESVRRQREAALAASEERFRLAFDNAPVGVAMIGLRSTDLGAFLHVNAAMSRILGYGTDELVETDVVSLTHPEDQAMARQNLSLLAAGDVDGDLVEHRFLHADGHDVWVEASFSVIRDAGQVPEYVVGMLNDVTDRKRAEAELTHHALHDALTGLPNRALVTESLSLALARARRVGGGAGVLYIDLDNFKDVNDSLGHAVGDELLVEVARRLQGCMRDSDLAGRLGGDEFVVVCDGIAESSEMRAVAERVEQTLAIRLPLSGRMVTVSASIGIAFSPAGEDDPGDLLRRADMAMYRAKGNGRGRYEFADLALQARAERQIALEADLATAVSRAQAAVAEAGGDSELFLDYQPCFDARTGVLVACEALIRWRHPTRGLLSPGQFLDVAEERALMVPLGAWVLRAACEQGARWVRAFGDSAPEIWVNVSAAQLGRHRFASTVSDVLSHTGLAPDRLCLELTERQALSSAHSVLDDLHALPELGVRLAIDDFGTGYAGLEYLRRLPVAALKVDASYVAAIGRDATGAALAATVVGLGRALNLTVVAEGVETAEQRDAVSELGVDVLQGYLLARPGPAARVDAMLSREVATEDL